MTDNFKYFQLQPYTLAGAGLKVGDTTITLLSMEDIDGNLVAMTDFGDIGFATIEPNNGGQEEQISFSGITQNANGTATLTGVKTVLMLSPYTQTSGVAKNHIGSSKLVISNTSGYYNKFLSKDESTTLNGVITFTQNPQGITPGGVPDASKTVKGAVKLSVTAVGDPIVVGENDGRIPTQDQKDALAGTGTPSVSNKYVTADNTGVLNNMYLTGNQSIDGVKTFTDIPLSTNNPTTDLQLSSKDYADSMLYTS